MLKLSQTIPEVIDLKDEQSLRDFLTAVKLCVEEIARKAKSRQTEVIAAAPTAVTQFDVEGDEVYCSADNKIYSLLNGAVCSITTA